MLNLFEEVNKAKENCPDMKYIIMIEDFEQYKDLDYVLSYEDLINKGKELNSNDKSELEKDKFCKIRFFSLFNIYFWYNRKSKRSYVNS